MSFDIAWDTFNRINQVEKLVAKYQLDSEGLAEKIGEDVRLINERLKKLEQKGTYTFKPTFKDFPEVSQENKVKCKFNKGDIITNNHGDEVWLVQREPDKSRVLWSTNEHFYEIEAFAPTIGVYGETIIVRQSLIESDFELWGQ